MKITVEGFQTYQQKHIVELPDSGVTLIEGASGKGKSTILRAIVWVLYGKEKSPYSWNSTKKKCYVQLELVECVIFRQKNPERLTLTLADTTLSSEEAQAWIIKKWGSRDCWITTSYMEFKRSMLVYGTTAEKIALLEEWAFPDDPPSVWIEKFNKEKKNHQLLVDDATTHLNVFKKSITITVVPDTLSRPIETYTREEKEKAKKELVHYEKLWGTLMQRNQWSALKESLIQNIEELTRQQTKIEDDIVGDDEIQQLADDITLLEHCEHLQKDVVTLTERVNNMATTTPEIATIIDTVKNLDHSIQQQNVYESLVKQCLLSKLPATKTELVDLVRRLEDVETHYDDVVRYNAIKATCAKVVSAKKKDMYSEDDIALCRQLEKQYSTYVDTLNKWKIPIVNIDALILSYKRYSPILPGLTYYDEYRKLLYNYTRSKVYEDDENLDGEIAEIQTKLAEAKQSLDVHSCPHCSKYIRMINNKLAKADAKPSSREEVGELEATLQSLTKQQQQVAKLKTLHNQYSVFSENDDDFKQAASLNPKLVNVMSSLVIVEAPTISLKQMTEHNTYLEKMKLEKKLIHVVDFDSAFFKQPLKDIMKMKLTAVSILAQWVDASKWTSKQLTLAKTFSNIVQQLKQKQEEVDSLPELPNVDVREILEIQKSLRVQLNSSKHEKVKMEKQLVDVLQKMSSIESISSSDVKNTIDELRVYISESDTVIPYLEKKAKIDDYAQVVKKEEEMVGKYNQLIEKSKQLEHTLLEQYLSTLNSLIESTIGDLFDDPIYFSFELFKGDRPSVRMNLIYKGGNSESITELSNGEQIRVVLAITTALTLTGNFPYLFIDDCIGFLDPDNRERCLNVVKNVLQHKAVYSIAHNETEGDYNHKYAP